MGRIKDGLSRAGDSSDEEGRTYPRGPGRRVRPGLLLCGGRLGGRQGRYGNAPTVAHVTLLRATVLQQVYPGHIQPADGVPPPQCGPSGSARRPAVTPSSGRGGGRLNRVAVDYRSAPPVDRPQGRRGLRHARADRTVRQTTEVLGTSRRLCPRIRQPLPFGLGLGCRAQPVINRLTDEDLPFAPGGYRIRAPQELDARPGAGGNGGRHCARPEPLAHLWDKPYR